MNTDRNLTQTVAILALITGSLLLIPLIAMQFTDEVVWTLSDFIFAGTLIFGTGLTYKLLTKKTGDVIYRLAVGSALGIGFLLIWVNLAVGIIGTENNPINLFYFGVLAVGLIGAFIVRFQPNGMAFTLLLTAFAHTLVTVYALLSGEQHALTGVHHSTTLRSVMQILGVNGFFITLWIISALLFKYSAQEKTKQDEA